MLPFAARRLAVRYLRPSPSLSTAFRHAASTKPRPKSRIVEAITNPKPPVLARWPVVYYTFQSVKYFLGFAISWHIFFGYFFAFSQAEGVSMTPTFNATGDWLLLSKRYRRGRDVVVGDLISYKHPIEPNTYGVKRVLGMPGDFVLRDTPDTSGLMIQVGGTKSCDIVDCVLIFFAAGTGRPLLHRR